MPLNNLQMLIYYKKQPNIFIKYFNVTSICLIVIFLQPIKMNAIVFERFYRYFFNAFN